MKTYKNYERNQRLRKNPRVRQIKNGEVTKRWPAPEPEGKPITLEEILKQGVVSNA